jgi:hypothetical protein
MGSGGYGLIGDVVVGMLGAVVGGWLGSMLLGIDVTGFKIDVTGFNFTSVALSVVGGDRRDRPLSRFVAGPAGHLTSSRVATTSEGAARLECIK